MSKDLSAWVSACITPKVHLSASRANCGKCRTSEKSELTHLYQLIMAGPMLKFKNKEKMHISRGPGVRSWGILIGKF